MRIARTPRYLSVSDENNQAPCEKVTREGNKDREITYLGRLAHLLTDDFPLVGFVFFDGREEGGTLP